MLPKDFKFGFSEAGFQFEMGISEPDTNTDWYSWSHDAYNITHKIVSGDLPENGAGYWDLYEKDHENAKKIGMNAGRIGIEWSRIFPSSTEGINVHTQLENGDLTYVEISGQDIEKLDKLANKKNVEHYFKLFSDFKSKNNFLIINLYHWSTPLWINDPSKRDIEKDNAIGNNFNTRSIIEFSKFAAYVAWKFGDFADRWATMNEPNIVFGMQSSNDTSPDSVAIREKYFTEAHARAYDAIKLYSNKPVGVIYANGDIQFKNPEDKDLVQKVEYGARYSFFDAIKNGNLKWYVDSAERKGIKAGSERREDMKGKLDWVGVNYYSRDVLKREDDRWISLPGYGYSCDSMGKSIDGRSVSETGWEVYPEGLYNVIMSYSKNVGVPMIISENGIADDNDILRPRYLVSHIKNMERAMKDGAKVEGYFHWALTDNFEWASGFSKKFGLMKVDFETKKRYFRPSALVFKEIATNREIPEELEWLGQDKF
ncbi:MAG: beta-galactosidase BgaS [Thermoplasmatales archaeon]